MYQHLTDWETHAENMQISVCFCKTCICLKNLENIQISVNMINRLDITDEYSVKCDFILNTVTFIDAALNISLRKLWKCNVLWFYLFGQGVPNETKGTINLKRPFWKFWVAGFVCFSTADTSYKFWCRFGIPLDRRPNSHRAKITARLIKLGNKNWLVLVFWHRHHL